MSWYRVALIVGFVIEVLVFLAGAHAVGFIGGALATFYIGLEFSGDAK